MQEETEYINVYGARVHNLKNIDAEIPRNSLTVITGLSGSGKSSLAFDTIFAEGQRRYIETFSAYARNFLGNLERPDVDKITGLSPVISIEQKTTNKNPRSTVGTTTEVYDYLRLLYARAGEAYSYLSGEEVMSIYKVKQMWLYTTAKRNQIPMCRIAGKNYYSKSHVEECLGLTVDTSIITEWLTTDEVFEEFGMKATAIRAYAYRHSIPTKKEYGITYYSKTHLAELRQMDMMADERYCTVNEVSEKYGLSKANIHHITKVHGIEKKKVGVRNLLLRADVERAMVERAAKGL